MKITIPYRRGRAGQAIMFGLGALVLVLTAVFLLRTGSPAAGGCALITLIFAAFPLWSSVSFLVRVIRRTGCFSVTSDGLENLQHLISLGCFSFPVTIRLIPWSCIDSFRIDRASGGEKVVLIAKDPAEFPKGYSPFVRSLLERDQNRGICGFSFDVRSADRGQKELFDLLQRELDAFRRRDYPAGWPETPSDAQPDPPEANPPFGS